MHVERVVAKGNSGHRTCSEEEITMRVRNEKKGEMLKKKMFRCQGRARLVSWLLKLNTQVVAVPGPTFMANNIPNFGNEPVITGTAYKLGGEGKMSAPVVGNQGVFVIRVDNITSKPPTTNLADYGKFIVNNISTRFSRKLGSNLSLTRAISKTTVRTFISSTPLFHEH
jgi:hypothetical protein